MPSVRWAWWAVVGWGGCIHLPSGRIPTVEASTPVTLATLTEEADGGDVAWSVLVRAGWRLDPIDQPGMAWTAAAVLAHAALPGSDAVREWRVQSGPETLALRLACRADAATACARFLGTVLATPRWRPEVLGGLADEASKVQAAAVSASPERTRAWIDGLVLEGRAGATSGVEGVAGGQVPTSSALDAWWRTTAVRGAVWIGRTPSAAATDDALLEALDPLSSAMPPDRPAARAPRPSGREGLWVPTPGSTSVGFGGVLPASAGEPQRIVVEAWLWGTDVALPGLVAGRSGAAAWWVQADGDDLAAAWTAAEARRDTPSSAPGLDVACTEEEATYAAAWSHLTRDADVCRVRPLDLDADAARAWWRETVDAWSAVVVIGPDDPRGRVGTGDIRWRVVAR